ncbi:hypothetical protein BT93_L4122 [Corymbia citriodora subsp. variegata]|uniref:17.4 kDa class III heat shock protein n=1 Tax=Corymbia citriodora subsp. variegata TaxID=360336 RepID=A0A8T0CLA4_CORYI|nr:hypothetical protein BT93_L4122 [Corymbia citriodora subsp. variegata]
MSRVVLDGDHLLSHLLNFPDGVEKLAFSSRPHEAATGESKSGASIPADILETPKEYVFYFDVPGLSKSDIQVTLSSPPSPVSCSFGAQEWFFPSPLGSVQFFRMGGFDRVNAVLVFSNEMRRNGRLYLPKYIVSPRPRTSFWL